VRLDNDQRRIFRLAFGVLLSSAVAIGFSWPLSYLAPMLAVNIIGADDVPPAPKKAAALLLIIIVGLFSGVIFSSLFINQPILSCLLLTIIFYWIYYFSNTGALPNLAGIMLIVGMTVIPMMSQFDPSLASGFALAFLYTAVMALIFSYISHLAFPHLANEINTTAKPLAIVKSPEHSRRVAGISTLIVVPAVIFFLTFNLIHAALTIMFIAILSLNPALEQGKKAGIGLLLGNALGGAITIVFYNIMKTAPHYGFYLVLISIFALFISQRVNSDKQAAPLWGMALTTLLVLTGPIFTGAGDDAQDKFSTRLFYIGLAATYIIFAFRITAQMWPKEEIKPQKTV
jgi:hypothetical protein